MPYNLNAEFVNAGIAAAKRRTGVFYIIRMQAFFGGKRLKNGEKSGVFVRPVSRLTERGRGNA